ncbi:MAG TPA: hypothetical protein VGK74_06755 [Symbiobacteriaceae bacterium]
MDGEEFSALVGAVKEIAAAVKRIEDRLDHMDGRQARMETDLQEFRRETRVQLTMVGRRLDHHDRMLMDHDRRVMEVEKAQADS